MDPQKKIEARSTLVQRTAAPLDHEASACGEWAEVDRVYFIPRMSIWFASHILVYIYFLSAAFLCCFAALCLCCYFAILQSSLVQVRASGKIMAFCAGAISRAPSNLLSISKRVSGSTSSLRPQRALKISFQPQQIRHKSYITPPEGKSSSFT